MGGDAGHYKDPLSSHGLTDALRDAELLARAIAAVIVDGADEKDALAGHRWTDRQIGDLLVRLDAAMADEVDTLAVMPPLTLATTST